MYHLFFRLWILVGLSLLITQTATSQQFMLDNPVRAGEVIVFPKLKSEKEFYYLPNKIQLARTPESKPQFSFIKYVKNIDANKDDESILTESNNGGGIVHAVFILETDAEQLKQAETELRKKYTQGKIIGPVLFKGGTVALISSFNQPNGETVKKVVGLGTAPTLEGSKLAISVQLTKEGADILWATFETPTPDFSISLEMQVEGYLSPKQVKITADWSRLYEHRNFQAAVATPMLSAEIVDTFDDLKDQGAIKVEQIGEDENLERLMQTAYDKLTNLMFDKIGGTGVPELSQLTGGQNQKSMLDRATESLEKNRQETRQYNMQMADRYRQRSEMNERTRQGAYQRLQQSFQQEGRELVEPNSAQRRNGGGRDSAQQQAYELPPYEAMPTISAAISYVMKRQRQTGNFTVDLSKFTSDTRTFRFDENVGNVKKNCPACFVRVNLDDPLYKQREIHTRLDGLNFSDFGTYVNSVEVSLRKKHANGETTVQGIVIDKRKFNEATNDYVMQYGWKGDDNQAKWLGYEYKTKWSFFGGYTFETNWQATEANSLTLAPPLYRKPVYIEVDPDLIQREKMLAAEVKIAYTVNGAPKTEKILLRKSAEELSKTVYLMQPPGEDQFEYQVTWFPQGKPPLVKLAVKTTYGYLSLNQLN